MCVLFFLQGSKTTTKKQQVSVLVPGDIFGEKMYLFGGTSTAAVIADAEVGLFL